MTFERALQIRQLAATLPADVPVLETDAPDIPPQWLYVKAGERARAAAQSQRAGRVAAHRPDAGRVARLVDRRRPHARTAANATAALPRLVPLMAAARA